MPAANFVIAIVVVVAVLLIIRFAVVYERKKAQARMDLAASRGWTYNAGTGFKNHYLLEGRGEGFGWRVEARRGGKNNPGHTSFSCPEAPAGGGVVYIGAPGIGAFLQSGVGRTITHWGLHLGQAFGASSAPMERLLDNPVQVDTEGTAFGEHFSVLATDASLAHKLLTARAKESLLAWQPKGRRGPHRSRGLSVTWSDEGLTLNWPTDAQEPEDMAAFAELGMTLVKEVQARGTW